MHLAIQEYLRLNLIDSTELSLENSIECYRNVLSTLLIYTTCFSLNSVVKSNHKIKLILHVISHTMSMSQTDFLMVCCEKKVKAILTCFEFRWDEWDCIT